MSLEQVQWDPKAIFRSNPDDCDIDDVCSPIFTLPSGKRVTTVPLVDKKWGLRARLVRTDAEAALKRLGLKLPSRETFLEIDKVGFWIKPVTLSYGDEMRTFGHASQHDLECWRRLAANGWDGRTVVWGFGKLHCAGAAPGNNRLIGWKKEDGTWYQSGTGDNHLGEADSLHDYGTLTMGEVDDGVKREVTPITKPVVTINKENGMKLIQARNFRKGRSGKIDLIVLHSMEAAEKPTTAEGVANWWHGPGSPVSSCHYCVDNDSVVQCVYDEDTAWHAPGANHNGIGIEHAGFAKQTKAEWLDDYGLQMLGRSAELAAKLVVRHTIPVEFVDAEGLKVGKRGFTTHAEVSKAFKKSDHYDPGKGFPLAEYLDMVRNFVALELR